MSLASPDVIEDIELNEFALNDTPWQVIVSNDNINLFSFVEKIFVKVLKVDEATAHKYALMVHNDGRCAVYSGNQEECQSKAEILMSYQLWTHVEKAGE